jgi:SpoVK/Ycf46/Vps4 family AAA+-type ATPase
MTTRQKSTKSTAIVREVATRSQKVAADITALLRARNPLLWIVTREEARVEQYLTEAAAVAGYIPYTWDTAQGARTIAGTETRVGSNDAGDMLQAIAGRAESGSERAVWIMRDLAPWLRDLPGAVPLRILRNLVRSLPATKRDSAQAIIVLSASGDLPPELSNAATVIEWPLPDRAEIADILDAAVASLPDDIAPDALPRGARDAAIDATVGLSGEEAQACYAKSLVQTRQIVPAAVAAEKKRVIARERVLEWHDPIPAGLSAVGGLENLKEWLVTRASAYSPKARAYGLPAPRGALLVGISGCGKSLVAKAIATAWGVPLLRLDLGALKSKFVGESEGNLRRALRVIEAIGRCVVWLDEVEKALQGATSGASDGGVSSDALGAILSWMQERSGEAFVIATANDVTALPPEFLRKGRFDEVWWVDLPNENERVQILSAALKSYKRSDRSIAYPAVAAVCDRFTGAEIAAIVPDAMFAAFNDGGREITTNDLITAAKTVVPLAATAAEKIDALRKWAEGRARFASRPIAQSKTRADARGRNLDI